MKEDAVYVAAKRWFSSKGFIALAGQPPAGCDNIPVVEIKTEGVRQRGSAGAYKPDLLLARSTQLIIAECKPEHSESDILKLLDVADSESRKVLLFQEIAQRGLLKRAGLSSFYGSYEVFSSKLRFCVCHAGIPVMTERVGVLTFHPRYGSGVFYPPTNGLMVI